MLQKINDVPDYVAGFAATGSVDKNDYDNLMIPELERVDKAHGHIHLLMVLNTPVKNFSLGAWLQDAWMGMMHFRGWKKIAIVTDESAIESFSDIFGKIMPGQTKGFKLSELDDAKKWVASED